MVTDAGLWPEHQVWRRWQRVVFGQQSFRTSTTGFSGVATGAFNDAHGRVVYNRRRLTESRLYFGERRLRFDRYQASAWFGLRDNRRELDAAATLAADHTGVNFPDGGRRYPIHLYHEPFLRFGFKW